MNAILRNAWPITFVSVLVLTVSAWLPAQPEPDIVDAEPDMPEVEFREVPRMGLTLPIYDIEVYDGDTVVVEARYKMRVRLLDCWAPEIRGPQKIKGERAKKAMERICKGKDGLVQIPWHDDIGKMTSMGRVLGSITVNGDDIAYELRKTGLAVKTKEEAIDAGWDE